MQLKAIELKGFQVFDQLTRIDFGDITLFFGPNSAGKSAITDALMLISELTKPSQDFSNAKVAELLDRWARRNQVANAEQREVFIGVETTFDLLEDCPFNYNFRGTLEDRVADIDEELWKSFRNSTIRIEASLMFYDWETLHDWSLLSFYVYIDSHPILSIQIDEDFGNENPELSRFHPNYANGENWTCRLFEYGPHQSEIAEIFRDSYWISKDDSYHPGYPDENRIELNGKSYRFDEIEVEEMSSSLEHLDLLGAMFTHPVWASTEVNAFSDHWRHLFGWIFPLPALEPTVINGNRSFDPELMRNINVTSSTKQGFDSMNWINQLARMGLASRILEMDLSQKFRDLIPEHKYDRLGAFGYEHTLQTRADSFTKLNTMLETTMFTEKMYQIEPDLELSIKVNSETINAQETPAFSGSAVINLKLKDGQGDLVAFEDVGNGIPFCMPWLVALTGHRITWIHQPELHLHPALQSRIGDILIQSIERNRQVIVETHSEHLILRLLRRIKQGQKQNNPFPLRSDQLEVYYFDPSPRDGTRVTRLPVTPAGDFYLPWPKGFFRDRDEDLFYEGD